MNCSFWNFSCHVFRTWLAIGGWNHGERNAEKGAGLHWLVVDLTPAVLCPESSLTPKSPPFHSWGTKNAIPFSLIPEESRKGLLSVQPLLWVPSHNSAWLQSASCIALMREPPRSESFPSPPGSCSALQHAPSSAWTNPQPRFGLFGICLEEGLDWDPLHPGDYPLSVSHLICKNRSQDPTSRWR